MLSARNISVRYEEATGRPAGRADRTAASLLLGGITVFQAGLAAGEPWGRLAWGGTHDGTLPPRLRAASGVATVLWGATTVAVAVGFSAALFAATRWWWAFGLRRYSGASA